MKNPLRIFFKKGETPPEEKSGPREVTVNYEQVGSSGTNLYSGYLQDDKFQAMNGVQRAETYTQMRTDYQIKMLLSAVKNIIKSADWWVSPADIPEGEDDEEFIEHILFKDLDDPFEQFLSEALTLIEYGYSLFEVVHKVVYDHEEFGTYIGLRKLAWRAQRTIYQWNVNRESEKLESVTQIAYGDVGHMAAIPAEFLLLFNVDQEGANFEGISFLRSCYAPWIRKNTYLKLNAAGIEKYAIPTPVVSIPPGMQTTAQYSNLIKVLKNYTSHQKNYLTKPDGWTLDFNSNSSFDPSKVEAVVDSEDKRMTKSFLANFLELGMHTHGSHSLSSDLSDFFIQGIDFIAKLICTRMNSVVIKNLINLNRGPRKEYPELKCSGITDKAGKELSEVLKNLFDSKIIVPDNDLEDSIRERYRLPPRSEDGQRMATPAAVPGAQGNPTEKETPDKASFYERVQFARWKACQKTAQG